MKKSKLLLCAMLLTVVNIASANDVETVAMVDDATVYEVNDSDAEALAAGVSRRDVYDFSMKALDQTVKFGKKAVSFAGKIIMVADKKLSPLGNIYDVFEPLTVYSE